MITRLLDPALAGSTKDAGGRAIRRPATGDVVGDTVF
jgi:hypothetical protein